MERSARGKRHRTETRPATSNDKEKSTKLRLGRRAPQPRVFLPVQSRTLQTTTWPSSATTWSFLWGAVSHCPLLWNSPSLSLISHWGMGNIKGISSTSQQRVGLTFGQGSLCLGGAHALKTQRPSCHVVVVFWLSVFPTPGKHRTQKMYHDQGKLWTQEIWFLILLPICDDLPLEQSSWYFCAMRFSVKHLLFRPLC